MTTQQQDLFDIGNPLHPDRKPITPQAQRDYTFEDYLKMYCGDRELAMYWFQKHNTAKKGES